MGVQTSVRGLAFGSSGSIPGSGTAGSCGQSRFCFLRTFQAVVYSDLGSSHSRSPAQDSDFSTSSLPGWMLRVRGSAPPSWHPGGWRLCPLKEEHLGARPSGRRKEPSSDSILPQSTRAAGGAGSVPRHRGGENEPRTFPAGRLLCSGRQLPWKACCSPRTVPIQPPNNPARRAWLTTLPMGLTQKASGAALSLSPVREARVSETPDLCAAGGRPGGVSGLLSAHGPRPPSTGDFVSFPVARRMREEVSRRETEPEGCGCPPLPTPRPPLCHRRPPAAGAGSGAGARWAGPRWARGRVERALGKGVTSSLLCGDPGRPSSIPVMTERGGMPASASRAQALPSAVSHLLPHTPLLPHRAPPLPGRCRAGAGTPRQARHGHSP
ncbi:uncharacterized protein LOC116578031 isoform X2 [Mustela erminea]|uniref:uncharacterized protein LOC116578031 isoform X2 n=1 Tax=Mustela erminea TaxID=36723 RepID=UPI001387313B|nr:uncharacterized protein LOC116578031 isoform X2 [Mustela erminea]